MDNQITETTPNMKEQVLKLKSDGKKICQIAKLLGITAQAVHYNLDPNYKEKHLERQRKWRDAKRKERLANPKPRKQRIKTEKPLTMKQERVAKKQKAQQREELKKFKTIPVDNSEKVAVKLDHKTTVYVLPGYDLEALKKKYLKL